MNESKYTERPKWNFWIKLRFATKNAIQNNKKERNNAVKTRLGEGFA